MKLRGQLLQTRDLSSDDRGEMFHLMDKHYENVRRATFESDLSEKQWVITLRCELEGELRGFSTQMLLTAQVEGRLVKALFSGDTIIDRQFWGDTALMQVGGRLALSLIEQFPQDELYWFLISAGYKTYRFLPVFFRDFYPRVDVPTPSDMQLVLDTLARLKYPLHYDAARGIVGSDANQYCLREGIADVTDERRRDAHVRYFVERNPGHGRGDELCCIAPLARRNLTDAAYRILGTQV